MKQHLFTAICLFAFPLAALAGKPNAPTATDFTEHSPMMVSEWSQAFESLLEKPGLTVEQEQLIWRALNMSTVHLFDVKNVDDYDVKQGESLRLIMEEVRATLRHDQYYDLLSNMPTTQWFLAAIQAVPAVACNCYGLCDCNDVAPTYTRCQNTPCFTYIGGPTKVCQYKP